MIVFSIDPGPETSAYVLIDDGKIADLSNSCSNHDLKSLLSMNQYKIVAIEKIASFGMPVGAEIFETVFWSGRFAEAAKANQSIVLRVPRMDVKMNLCNNAKAKDANIRQALIDRMGPVGNAKPPGPTFGVAGDGWAALAVAVTVLDKVCRKEHIEIVR
jgi:hypothetical protein